MSKDKEFTGSKTIKQNTKMKKRIFGAALLIAIAVAAGWNYQQNKQDVQLSDLALENVEALAWDENKSNYHLFPCPSSSGNECRFKDSERPECYGPTYCR